MQRIQEATIRSIRTISWIKYTKVAVIKWRTHFCVDIIYYGSLEAMDSAYYSSIKHARELFYFHFPLSLLKNHKKNYAIKNKSSFYVIPVFFLAFMKDNHRRPFNLWNELCISMRKNVFTFHFSVSFCVFVSLKKTLLKQLICGIEWTYFNYTSQRIQIHCSVAVKTSWRWISIRIS